MDAPKINKQKKNLNSMNIINLNKMFKTQKLYLFEFENFY